MIYTITANPSIDYYLITDSELKLNGINRIENYRFEIGGKGINVSILLDTLGIKSAAMSFVGGFTGRYINEELNKHENITAVPVEVQGISRINVKTRHGRNEECDLNAGGPHISDEDQKKLISKLDCLTEEDYVLICGKSSNGMDRKFIEAVSIKVKDRKAKLVLDIPNPDLEMLETVHPWLIKPNLDEMKYMFPDMMTDDQNLIRCMKKLVGEYCDSVLLSLGGEGALFYDGCSLVKVSSLDLEIVDTTCAGDSMLGAFIGKHSQGADLEEALRWSGAAGNAAVTTVGLPSLNQICKYLNDIQIYYMNKKEK